MKIIQKFINLWGFIFIKLRYIKISDPFYLFYLLSKNHTIKEKNKGTILLAPIRVSPVSNLFEGLIGYFFKMKGYKVKALICDQCISFCDNKAKNDRKKSISCSICLAEQKRFCNFFGFEKISLKNNITLKEKDNIKTKVSTLEFKNDNDFIYKGVNYKNEICSGTLRYTLRSEIKTKNDFKILKKAAYTSFVFSTSFQNILEKEKSLDHLIISHGIYSTWGSILAKAKKNNLNTIVWGRGYVGQGDLMFGHNCSTHDESINEDNQVWKEKHLTISEREKVLLYFGNKFSGISKSDHVNYYDNINISDTNKEHFFTGLNSYKRIFGMFTNIPWDGQVFNKTEGFPTTRDYITNTISWFIANIDCALVIRSHPAEKTRVVAKGTETFWELLSELYPTLPKNIYFLEPENSITSYDLAKKIDVAILYGSTLSLEFAVMGIPVIQTGKYNVNGKNIVFEVNTKKDFWEILDTAKERKIEYTDEMKENAINYAYYWIFRRHIKDTTVNLHHLIFKNYHFQNINEFSQNQTMNFIYSKIINGEKIIY